MQRRCLSYGNVVESESSDERTRTKQCDQNYESGPGAVFTTLLFLLNLQMSPMSNSVCAGQYI